MKKIIGIVLFSIFGMASAWCITMDFESHAGYRTGNLAGQPSSGTQWSMVNGNQNFILVESGKGENGTNGLKGRSIGDGSNFVYYAYNTSDEDLGGTFDSDSSTLAYSFQWRPNTLLDGSVTAPIFVFTVGSDSNTAADAAMKLVIRSGGRLVALDGKNNVPEDGVFLLNEFSTVSGTIDYENKTYTVFVDGFQLFTHINGGNLRFENPEANNAYIRLGNLNGATEEHRSWNMDNLLLDLVQ